MRVAIVCVAARESERLKALAKAVGRGIEAQGHRVEFLDPTALPLGIAGYDYLVVGTESDGPWGRLPGTLSDWLGRCQGIGGKRAFGFARKSGLRPQRLLASLMSRLEAEGLRLTYSDLLSTDEEALAAGKEAPVERA